MDNDVPTESAGQSFYPDAFSGEAMVAGQQLAQLEQFYDAFIFYITAVAFDPMQLVHFRARIIDQAVKSCPRVTAQDITAVLWCALSLSTDRYFAAFANHARDGLFRVTDLKAKWYSFMAQAFVPTKEHQRLAMAELRSWGEEFIALHKHDLGDTLSQKEQVIRVIAKQALAGVAWQETNRQIMLDQNISIEEVKAEIARRS